MENSSSGVGRENFEQLRKFPAFVACLKIFLDILEILRFSTLDKVVSCRSSGDERDFSLV
jgi:hypothetical protein